MSVDTITSNATTAAPAAVATPAEKLPFPPNHVIIINQTFRAHSSGSETYSSAAFGSYESASKYIIDQFREGGNAQMYWDEDDCFDEDGDEDEDDDEDDEESLPQPTVEWACDKFSPAALKEFINCTKWDSKLYGPYSKFCMHCPYEIFIELCEVL